MSVEVLWQSVESVRYTVSCRSEGGSVVSSSLTGPNDQLLGQLAPVENEVIMRGADNYSLTVERSAGQNGDVFNCTAATGGSTDTAVTVLSG